MATHSQLTHRLIRNHKHFQQLLSLPVLAGLLVGCTAANQAGGTAALQNGDRRYCRDVCNQMPDNSKSNQNPPDTKPGQSDTKPEAVLSPVAGEYLFTEGPAADAQGNVYFSDISAGRIYKWSPDGQVSMFVEGLKALYGIVGTTDGKSLYVTDHGAGQTFVYGINPDGTLTNKQLFVSVGSDGMDLDARGNLYLTTPNQVQVFDAAGNHLRDIPTQENPTNVTFGGADRRTLFITARTAVYTLQM